MSESVHITAERENPIRHYENQAVIGTSNDPLEARFVIPVDEALVAKYRFVDERIEGWRQTDPAIVGVTAFGSTTKGYHDARTSDIDLTVFVDTDNLGLNLDPEVITADVCWDDWFAFINRTKLPIYYVDKAEEIFKDPEDANSQLPINVQVFPISHEYLRVLAAFEAKSALTLARYRQLQVDGHGTELDMLTDWPLQSSDAESLQELPGLMQALTSDPKLSQHRDVLTVRQFLDNAARREGTEIAKLRSAVFGSSRLLSNLPVRLFNLSLTPELQPYRQSFLESMATNAEPGIVWSYFVKRLAEFEDSSKHPRDYTKLRYPRSIDEALDWYA